MGRSVRLWMLAILIGAISSAASRADPVKTTLGNFIIQTDKDPFSDGSNVVAMAMQGTDVVAIRCVQNTLSVAIAGEDHPLEAGGTFPVKFRADSKEIIDVTGTAINTSILELDDSDKLVDELNGAKSVSFRVSGATASYTFTVPLKQSDKAVALVKKACGK